MIHYTEEEINDCIMSLIPETVKSLVDITKKDNPEVEEDYGELVLYITCPEGYEGYLICTVTSLTYNIRKNTWEILKVPLDQVPLYINSWPEIAKWRLRVGK